MPEFVEKFPIKPTAEQEKTLFFWIETCRRVWNIGLAALQELDRNTSKNKQTNPETGKPELIALPSCRLAVRGWFENQLTQPPPTGRFKNEVTDKDGKKEEVWAGHCWILPRSKKGGTVDLRTGEATHEIRPNLIRVGQCCPIRLHWKEPDLGIQVPGKYSLQYFFTQTNMRELHPYFADDFEQVPAWFVRGVCDSLWQAWNKYKSGLAGEPRFKSITDPMSSLTYGDGKNLKLALIDVPPKKTGNKPTAKDGTIAIPKLDINAKRKQVPGVLHVTDLGKRFTVEEEGEKVFRPLSVARIVRTPAATWQLHLTSLEISRAEIYDFCRLAMAREASGIVSPLAQFHLLTLSPWSLMRHQDAILTVPGEGYVVAVDDRGNGYSVLPRRHTDGALDPHNLIAKLDHQIEKLQKEISWKMECSKKYGTPRQSNRLKELKQRKKKSEARRSAILRSSRQKISYFITERSRTITLISKPVQRIRKPKAKLKPGEIGEFEPNGAEIVAERNKVAATSAPGEFIALIKRNATDRGQKLTRGKPELGSPATSVRGGKATSRLEPPSGLMPFRVRVIDI